jgi:osmoprotectant transport system permease protein
MPEKPVEPVKVGGASTPEQALFVEILAQAVEGAGLVAERKTNLGTMSDLHDAMKAGKVDVAVGYAGTALMTIARPQNWATVVGGGPSTILERVHAHFEPMGLVWTGGFGFDSALVLVVRGAGTSAGTVSEIAVASRNWRAAFPFSFQSRPDGLPNAKKIYGLEFAEVKTMNEGELERALTSHSVDVIVGSATDGSFTRLGFRPAVDDKRAFSSNPGAAVVRRAALDKFPGLGKVLAGFTDTLTTEQLRRMNEAVDGGQNVHNVAAGYIASLSMF